MFTISGLVWNLVPQHPSTQLPLAGCRTVSRNSRTPLESSRIGSQTPGDAGTLRVQRLQNAVLLLKLFFVCALCPFVHCEFWLLWGERTA